METVDNFVDDTPEKPVFGRQGRPNCDQTGDDPVDDDLVPIRQSVEELVGILSDPLGPKSPGWIADVLHGELQPQAIDDGDRDVLLPIDGLPPVRRRRRVAPAREVSRRPRYRRLRRPAHRCDDCMANYLTEPRSPLALPGRYERRVIGEGARLLCHEHVQHWRDRDAMPPLVIR